MSHTTAGKQSDIRAPKRRVARGEKKGSGAGFSVLSGGEGQEN